MNLKGRFILIKKYGAVYSPNENITLNFLENIKNCDDSNYVMNKHFITSPRLYTHIINELVSNYFTIIAKIK